jgi:hypothetical protein
MEKCNWFKTRIMSMKQELNKFKRSISANEDMLEYSRSNTYTNALNRSKTLALNGPLNDKAMIEEGPNFSNTVIDTDTEG